MHHWLGMKFFPTQFSAGGMIAHSVRSSHENMPRASQGGGEIRADKWSAWSFNEEYTLQENDMAVWWANIIIALFATSSDCMTIIMRSHNICWISAVLFGHMTTPNFPNQRRYRHMVKDELLQIFGGKSPEGPKTENLRRELPILLLRVDWSQHTTKTRRVCCGYFLIKVLSH